MKRKNDKKTTGIEFIMQDELGQSPFKKAADRLWLNGYGSKDLNQFQFTNQGMLMDSSWITNTYNELKRIEDKNKTKGI